MLTDIKINIQFPAVNRIYRILFIFNVSVASCSNRCAIFRQTLQKPFVTLKLRNRDGVDGDYE